MSLVLRNKNNNSNRQGRARNGTRRRRQQNQLMSLRRNGREGANQIVRVNAPISYGTVTKHFEADIRMKGANTCVLRHTEFIADVISTPGTFTAVGYPLNAAFNQTFHWMSIMASNWEKYKFRKLCFLYRAKSSTVEPGSVIAMVDYDSSDDPPGSKQIMMASNYADSNTWQSFEYDCLASNLGDTVNYRYTRFAAQPPNTDIKMYDLGKFYIATDGGAVSTTVGELHVSYEVELKTPQISGSIVNSLGSLVQNGGVVNINRLVGSAPVVHSSYPIVTEVTTTVDQEIVFNSVGTFIADMVTTGTNLGPTYSAGWTLVSGAATLIASYAVVNVAQTLASFVQIFQLQGAPVRMRLPQLAGATLLTSTAIRLAPYAYNYLGD